MSVIIPVAVLLAAALFVLVVVLAYRSVGR